MFQNKPQTSPTRNPDRPAQKMHPRRAFMQEAGRNLMRCMGSRKSASSTNSNDHSLAGQVIIVTGGALGIGRIVTEECAIRGARVIIACPDINVGQQAVDQIIARLPNTDLAVHHLDLCSFQSVKSFAQKIIENEDKVDVLINNAGMMGKERKETEDLHEQVIQVNYFAPVMLTMMLFDFLATRSPDPRIIFVSSMGHAMAKELFLKDLDWKCFPRYAYLPVYTHSKLAVMLFVRKLSMKAVSRKVRVYAADPGMAFTGITSNIAPKGTFHSKFMNVYRPFQRPVKEAAESILCTVLFDKCSHNPAVYYFRDGRELPVSSAAQNDATADELWNLTKEVLNLPAMDF